MADRRDFLKATLAATAAVAVYGVESASACMPCPMGKQGAGMPGILYTKQNPGMWAGKEAGHLPQVTVEGNKVTIETKHGMSEKHYIVRHTLVGDNGEVLGTKTFYPEDEKAVSTFELPEKCSCKMAIATSFCNLHDMWVTPVMLGKQA